MVHYPGMAFGAIVGVADIIDCVKISTLRRMTRYAHLHYHLHVKGLWCWILENAFRLEAPIPWRGQPIIPLPTLAPIVPTAKLFFELEHPFDHATVRVWIDGDEVLDEDLRGRVTRKVLSLRTYKGSFERTLDVAPGEHVIRVHVEGDDFSKSMRMRGTFESGEPRRLVAKVGGLLGKNLKLVWGSPPRE